MTARWVASARWRPGLLFRSGRLCQGACPVGANNNRTGWSAGPRVLRAQPVGMMSDSNPSEPGGAASVGEEPQEFGEGPVLQNVGEWLELFLRHTQMMGEMVPPVDQQLEVDRHALQEYLRDAPHVRETLQMLILAARSAQSVSSRSTGETGSQGGTGSGASSVSEHSSTPDSGSWGMSAGAQSSTGVRASSGSNDRSGSTFAQASSSFNKYVTTNSKSRDSSASSNSNSQRSEEGPPLLPLRQLMGYTRGVTTLTVYNIPRSYSQQDLLAKWPADGSYDFLHMRHTNALDRRRRIVNINFTSPELAEQFYGHWQGRTLRGHGSKKVMSIVVGSVQGREANMMMVLERSGELPVVLLGTERVSEEHVLGLVRLAKRGVFVDRA